MYFIYKILNIVNNKVYIGLTNNPIRRWNEHVATAFNHNKNYRNFLIGKAIKKYGKENFRFIIIEENISKKDGAFQERFWINYYKSNVIIFGDKFGYNLTSGGEGFGSGPKSQIHKDNISKSLLGKPKSLQHALATSEGKSSFSKDQLLIIKDLLLDNKSTYEIAKIFDTSQSIISDIKLGISHRYFYSNEDIKQFSLLICDKRGENNGSSKLKEVQVIEILNLLSNKVSVKDIMKMFNIGKSTVLRIKNGQSWTHVRSNTSTPL